METYFIKKTDKTPEVRIDFNSNTISISGICIPENPYAFFTPIVKEIQNMKSSKSDLLFEIYLEYFNTGASKCLLNLFLDVAKVENEFPKATINWIIEEGDTELREAGEVFEEISKLKFNYKEISGN